MAELALRHFRWWPRRCTSPRVWRHPRYSSTWNVAYWRTDLGDDHEDPKVPLRRIVSSAKTLEARLVPLARLPFEADVTSPGGHGRRLVDGSRYDDMDVWIELLRYRERREGSDGVLQIWRGMRDRGVRPPLQGPFLEELWTALCIRAIDEADLLASLIAYVPSTGQDSKDMSSFIYETIMSQCLERQPGNAVRILDQLRSAEMVPDRCAGILLTCTITSIEQATAFDSFKRIYLSSTERSLYDTCFAELKRHHQSFAVMNKWHAFLVGHGDLPSPQLQSTQEVKQLLKRSKWAKTKASPVEGLKIELDQLSQTVASEDRVILGRERFSSIVGEVHGVKRKAVTDAFCARVFATRGISSAMMIGGLSMLGLDVVGPLGLRELAARSDDLPEFKGILRNLRQRDIAVTDSAFTRALRKFADEGRQDLFDSIVASDMHPDAYEDLDLVERVATSHLEAGRHVDAHALMTLLGKARPKTAPTRFNQLLQAEARGGQPERVSRLMHDMLARGETIELHTFVCIQQNLLRPREKGHQPSKATSRFPTGFDDTRFVKQLFLNALKRGEKVPGSCWREVLRRYGMSGRMDDLGKLANGLAQHYGADETAGVQPGGAALDPPQSTKTPLVYNHPLRLIFSTIMQRAIVAWGFKAQAMEGEAIQQKTNEWLTGITLLALLRDLGVPIDVLQVRQEVIARLGVMYTPGLSSKAANRVLKDRNTHRLEERFDLIQQAWGGQGLFRIPEHNQATEDADARAKTLFDWLFFRSGWWRKSRARAGKKMQALPKRHAGLPIRGATKPPRRISD